jgi:hypothetical protein
MTTFARKLMNAFVDQFRWIMFVSGALTSTMFYAAIDTVAAQRANFGGAMDDPVAQILVRNWGVLVGLIGLMLIYGAFNAVHRRMALLVGGASKVAFIALVLTFGQSFLSFQVGTAVLVDSLMVLLFAIYLVATAKGSAGARLASIGQVLTRS